MNKNEIFTLWIPNDGDEKLPLLAHLSLKSMVLCGHDVVLYTYHNLENIPEGVKVLNGNEILDSSKIFMYKEGHQTYAGFADLFRLYRLYKYGGTWLDLDVLLIRNINEKYDDEILICSEPTFRFYLHPNNGLLRFPKGDPLIKYMLDYAEEMGEDITHGQTGPRLISNILKKFPEYNQFLKHFNIYHLFGWKYLNDYSKSPKKILNKINMNEIIGFHINNTFFEKILTTKNPNGLFEILKKSILNSNTYKEYFKY
ncbi:MAG: glycosyltransferase [Methanobrevibacter sp.]